MKSRRVQRSQPPDICREFGRAVQARRVEVGLTQEELAARAGINRTYLGDVERGARNVALRNLQRIAAALDISVASLFEKYRVEG